MADNREPEWRLERIGQDVGGGIFLIFVAVAAFVGSWSLSFGQLSGVGPGLMPRVTAILVALIGVAMIVQSLLVGSEPLARWSVRGPLFVLGAILVFALTIRPLGLAFAGPAAMLLASLADPTTRMREIVPFAIILPALCILMFKYALRLPIPLAPPLLGY